MREAIHLTFTIFVRDSKFGQIGANKSMKDKKLKPQEIAFKVGEIIGGLINDKKIGNKIAFDRGSYLYHGRVKQLADGVRSKGISL